MSDDTWGFSDPGWSVDSDGYIVSRFGSRCARMRDDGTLMLYDKRIKMELPFSPNDWAKMSAVSDMPSDDR